VCWPILELVRSQSLLSATKVSLLKMYGELPPPSSFDMVNLMRFAASRNSSARESMIAVVFLLLLVATPAFAGDHASEYQVGVFSATGQLSDGSFAHCQGGNCSAYSAAHNIHYVRTNTGMYAIAAPISIGWSLTAAVLTDGMAPTVYKQWFMDQLHSGDKILFASKCTKHNNCVFWLPDPDKTGKEYVAYGYYRPDVAKTNTQSLCGKGKLPQEVEAQVCAVAITSPISSPVQEQKAVPAPIVRTAAISVPAPVPVSAPITPAANAASMVSPAIGSTLAGPVVSFTWITAAGGTNYYVWLGTTGVGSNNLAVGGKTGTNSTMVGGLPTNGETIYVRLWTELGPDAFRYTDYTYKAATFTN
jgi:hypothetical protein